MTIGTSELESLRDELIRARMSGVLVLRHGDKLTQFKTDAEMAKAIADIDKQIAAAGRRSSVGVAGFSRGDS